MELEARAERSVVLFQDIDWCSPRVAFEFGLFMLVFRAYAVVMASWELGRKVFGLWATRGRNPQCRAGRRCHRPCRIPSPGNVR